MRNHCHITGKFRGAAHWNYNVDFEVNKKIPVMFHYLKGYDSHIIMQQIGKFDVNVSVIPNGLEKYMVFIVNKNLVFIDSMEFMKSSLEKQVKNLLDDDFKYLTQEFNSQQLGLINQKGVYPFEYMDRFKRFFENKLPTKKYFYSPFNEESISNKHSSKMDISVKKTICMLLKFGMHLKCKIWGSITIIIWKRVFYCQPMCL